MVYKRVRGWTSERSLPVLNFVKYLPLPPRVGLVQAVYDYLFGVFLSL